MKTFKNYLIKSLIILFNIIIISCNQDETIIDESPTLKVPDIKYSNFLKYKLNIDELNFEYNSEMEAYIIDGDGVFPITSIDNWIQEFEGTELSKSTNNLVEKSQQQSYSTTLDNSIVSQIAIYIESDVSGTTWQTAISDAIVKWNSVGARVGFVETSTRSYADITITDYTDLDSNTIAWAYYPHSSTTPGREISINRKYDYLSSNRKLNAIMHEIGHTVGFRHTNTTDGDHITGTATSGNDNSSIMHSSIHGGTDFTYNDEVAIFKIYPSTYFSTPYSKTYSLLIERSITINWSESFNPSTAINLEVYKNGSFYTTIVSNHRSKSYTYTFPFNPTLVGDNMQIVGTVYQFGIKRDVYYSKIFTFGAY